MRLNSPCKQVAASAAIALSAACIVEGQQSGAKRYDAARGSWFVTVIGDSGTAEVEAIPADRVRAVVSPSVTPASGGGWRYVYRVTVGPEDAQPLDELEIPCPRTSLPRALDATGYSRAKGTRRLAAEFVRYSDRDVCVAPVSEYRAGDSLSLAFTSDFAPALGRANLLGHVPGVVWPFEVEEQVNGQAMAVVNSLVGISGGWREEVTIVPLRTAASLSTTGSTVLAMGFDLNAACGALGLITQQGVCTSLTQKLALTRSAIESGDQNALNHLVSFLNELDAQRAKHIPDAAYAVLSSIGQSLRAQLSR
jgi:hypothetical protein